MVLVFCSMRMIELTKPGIHMYFSAKALLYFDFFILTLSIRDKTE
jgi:hypothetical protein